MIDARAATGVPLPQSLETEKMSLDCSSLDTSCQPSMVDFFNAFLDLSQILQDVVLHHHYDVKQHDGRPKTSLPPSYRVYIPIIELEAQLQSWEENLAPHLKPRSRSKQAGDEANLYRAALVLQQW